MYHRGISRRLLAALLCIAAAAALIAGCGDDDGLSPEAVAKAADRTVAKGSSRVAINQTITVLGQRPIPMAGEGIFDTRTGRGRLTLDLSKVPGLGQTGGVRALQEIVIDGFTIYMRKPVFVPDLPEGKTWLKIDIGKAGKAAGIDLGALAQTGQDPTQALRYLKATSGDAEKVGEEDVRGTPTTHYKATLDLRRYVDTVPPRQRPAVRRTIEQVIRLSGSSKVPTEIWIGEDDLVRRMEQTVKTRLTPTIRATLRQRFEFFDFGARADIEVPPAGDTVDATKLAARGLSGATQ